MKNNTKYKCFINDLNFVLSDCGLPPIFLPQPDLKRGNLEKKSELAIRCVLNYFELCILRNLVPRSFAAQAKFIIRCRITWKHFWVDAATWHPKGAVIHQNLCSQLAGKGNPATGSCSSGVLYIHTHTHYFFVAAHII